MPHDHDHHDEDGESLGPCRLLTPGAATQYALAGRAVITLKSQATGRHFTYEIDKAKDQPDAHWGSKPPVWFVRVRHDGQDSVYLGMINQHRHVKLTAKSKFRQDSPAVAALSFFAEAVLCYQRAIPAKLEVWHEGSCGRCGRALTHPESLELGIGPVCAEYMGLAGLKKVA